jgi:hypothetical protein
MKPAAGTKLHFIGTEGVLFSEPRQEVHAFNTTACVIWCHLEDGLTPPRIARALADESGLDEATSRAHVAAALADWTAKGLLMDVPAVPLAAPPAASLPGLAACPTDRLVISVTWRLLGVIVRVRFTRESDATLVRPLFDHLPREAVRPADHVVDIAAAADGIGFYLDGQPAAFCQRDDEIAPVAKGVIWTAVLRRQDYLLHIHAGAVGGPAGCVLLPAAPGGGKSTLTLTLVHAGFDLFSDEVALLAAADLTVAPFPTAICVKEAGIGVVANLYPEIGALPIHLRGDGMRVVYMPPPHPRVSHDGHRRPVCGIVFPRYRAGAPFKSRRLEPANALARLLTHCQHVGRALDHAAIQRLIGWIKQTPCAEIEYGSSEQARNLVGAILRGGR